MLGLVLPEGYALIDRLGKGAMGQVYEGLRVEGDAEPERVAVKVLRLALRDAEDERRRFEHEAELTARLSSPFIVKVHGHGVLSDARFDRVAYILLELLEGETMAERMAQRPLGPLVIADVLDGIASAVDEAHTQGIIQRDLKPTNVILVDEVPKVIDFGLARIQEIDQTRTGQLVGTPAYMAPEQFSREEHRPGDHRIDIYALGAMAFHAITGEAPFRSRSIVEVIKMHRNEPVPPLPNAETDPIAEACQDVIHKAMAKDPDDRFVTAGAFAIAFRRAAEEAVGAATTHADFDPELFEETPMAGLYAEVADTEEEVLIEEPLASSDVPTEQLAQPEERRWLLAIIAVLAAAVAAWLMTP